MQDSNDGFSDILGDNDVKTSNPSTLNFTSQSESSQAINVDITDAMSEKDRVVYTVRTLTSLATYRAKDISVKRQHDDFVWLHDQLEETPDYCGLIVPPAPPPPDFKECIEKLKQLSEAENTMTTDEFDKMKKELEAEYLATFKKTVAMHLVFLKRLSKHPVLFKDYNLRFFLEHEDELFVRGKNTREKLSGIMQTVTKSADERLILSTKDEDPFFTERKTSLNRYHVLFKEARVKADRMTAVRKTMAINLIPLSTCFLETIPDEQTSIKKIFSEMYDFIDALHKIEARISTDDDLKLSDSFRYYELETNAAKDLLYRRSKAMVEQESCNRALEKARTRGTDVTQAEKAQGDAYEKFCQISKNARDELENFEERRIQYFQENLKDLATCNIKNAKGELELIKKHLNKIKCVN